MYAATVSVYAAASSKKITLAEAFEAATKLAETVRTEERTVRKE